ncbi:Ichor [Frankliniella fusca]|uniref:Ichor n=1 Tax=Frankliniella fusca TaxID=407009 RepID=A0AAE1HWW3_9NEOP|nr:Ichor [Frankliniella fusca]
MLTEYESYMMADGGMDAISSSGQQVDAAAYVYRDLANQFDALPPPPPCWPQPQPEASHPQDDAYTLTVLSDAGEPAPPPPPPQYSLPPWGSEPWQLHGPAHAGNPFEDDAAVSGSDGSSGSSGSSPERRCVRSLLHVALQRGGQFAQQYTSCGVPPLPLPHMDSLSTTPGFVKQEAPSSPAPPPCYLKQEMLASPGPGVFVSSSTSCCSPRPATPAESLRSCYSPASSTSAFLPLAPAGLAADDGVVSTTTTSGYLHHDAGAGSAFSPAPPAYSAFRTPYPTPSPDPCYPGARGEPYSLDASMVPLPVHLLSTTPSAPPPPLSSRAAKRRRSRAAAAAAAHNNNAVAPARKRERSERQLHPCTLCDKRFKDNYSVNVHMRTHTGEKPFPCIVCGKMFRQKAHLAKHRSTHQPSEYAEAAASLAQSSAHPHPPHSTLLPPMEALEQRREVDGNSNSLMWSESKCKAPNVWHPTHPSLVSSAAALS